MPNPSTETGIVVVLLITNLFQLILQIAQMFFSNRQSSKDLLIKDLQDRLTNLENDLKEERMQRRKLEITVFDLTKEKAFLDGQLEAQLKRKESLILDKFAQNA